MISQFGQASERSANCFLLCSRRASTHGHGSGTVRAESSGSADLIVTAYRTGRTITIVPYNSGAAIAAYLAHHSLTSYVRAIVARDDQTRTG